MADLLVIVVPLVAYTVLVGTRSGAVVRRCAAVTLCAVARASSADGALTRLEAEVTYRIIDVGVRAPAGCVPDRGGGALHAIVNSRVLAGMGDEVALADGDPAPGLAVLDSAGGHRRGRL